MRYKKFLLIPVVFIIFVFVYASFINSLGNYKETVRESSNAQKIGEAEVIGVGQAVSVQVIRATKPYLFGLVNLPTYAQGYGNLATLHAVFFWSLYAITIILTTVFIIIERRNVKMPATSKHVPARQNLWMRLAKSIGIGAVFALVAFIISDNSASLALGLLVAYLEFRLFQ